MSFLKKLQENRAEKVQEMETLVNTAKTEERAMAQEELENRLTAPLRQKKEPEKKKVSRRKRKKKSLPQKNWKKERSVIIS